MHQVGHLPRVVPGCTVNKTKKLRLLFTVRLTGSPIAQAVHLRHRRKAIFVCTLTSLHSKLFKATLNRRQKEALWMVKTTALDDFPSPVYSCSCILFKYPPLTQNHKSISQNLFTASGVYENKQLCLTAWLKYCIEK